MILCIRKATSGLSGRKKCNLQIDHSYKILCTNKCWSFKHGSPTASLTVSVAMPNTMLIKQTVAICIIVHEKRPFRNERWLEHVHTWSHKSIERLGKISQLHLQLDHDMMVRFILEKISQLHLQLAHDVMVRSNHFDQAELWLRNN